jgi:hypothetical protein
MKPEERLRILKAKATLQRLRLRYRLIELRAAGIDAEKARPSDYTNFERAALVESLLRGHKERRDFLNAVLGRAAWAKGLTRNALVKRLARYTKRHLRHRPKGSGRRRVSEPRKREGTGAG